MIDLATELSYQTPVSNSTLLLPLLFSLMRDRNVPKTSTSFFFSYDYIIVGAGSSGSTVASRLSEEKCVSVLLLEAGGTPPLLNEVPFYQPYFLGTQLDWSQSTVPQKHAAYAIPERKIRWPSGRGLGGSSLLNGMLYVRANRHNYNDWAALGADGWSYEEILPYFLKSEDNLNPQYVANGFHGTGGPMQVENPKYYSKLREAIIQTAEDLGFDVIDSNAARQTGFDDFQSTTRIGQRCSTAKAFLIPAENRENLDIVTNAFVRKVIFDGNRATGVLVDIGNITFEIEARREVIMTAGTVNTAQLLMLSGIGPKEELEKFNIPVVADLPVGENLQDHAATVVEFVLDKSKIQPIKEKAQDPLNIIRYIYNRTGLLTSTLGLDMLAFLNINPEYQLFDSPDFQVYMSEVSSSDVPRQFSLEGIYKQYYDTYEGFPMFGCYTNALKIRSRGSVKLQSTNPYDEPLIDPNYFSDYKDLKDTVEGMKMCYRIGTSAPFVELGSTPLWTAFPGCEAYELYSTEYFVCRALSITTTLSHQVGTAKMGRYEDPTTVVDPQLRVKGVQGLRVADASIMPLVLSGNTNAATIMVAEKASDMIKETIYCYKN